MKVTDLFGCVYFGKWTQMFRRILLPQFTG